MLYLTLSHTLKLAPHERPSSQPLTKDHQQVWQTLKNFDYPKDFSESFAFIKKEKPFIGKTLLTICGINLFLSSMIMVGLPYLTTEVLNLPAALSNQLYGYAQGALTVGGIIGGISAGIFAKKLTIQKSGNLVMACAQPLGNALYGILFDLFSGREYLAILFSEITSLLIAFRAQILFKKWIS